MMFFRIRLSFDNQHESFCIWAIALLPFFFNNRPSHISTLAEVKKMDYSQLKKKEKKKNHSD